jgi:Peptidase family M23
MKRLIALSAIAFAVGLFATLSFRLWPELTHPKYVDPGFRIPSSIELASLSTVSRFDFPLGSENGALTYNAQRFTKNHHLGDDLNGIGGEDSDLGDPIYAVADGRVLLARDGGSGWGNIVIVLHAYIENGERKYVQSCYGHVETMLVQAGDEVRRGQQIASVGTAGGRYLPIGISKCASSSRRSSDRVIAKICGAGLTRLHSSKRTAARKRMIWDGQTRVGRAIDVNSFG